MWVESVTVTIAVPVWAVALVVGAAVLQAIATAWLHLTSLSLRDALGETAQDLGAKVDDLYLAAQDDASDASEASAPRAAAEHTASPSIIINVNRGVDAAGGGGGGAAAAAAAAGLGSGDRRARVISPSVLLMSPAPSRAVASGRGGILQRGSTLYEGDEDEDE